MAGCQGYVQVPVVKLQPRARKAAYGVDQDHDLLAVGQGANGGGDLLDGAGDAGAGFIVHNGHGIEFAAGQVRHYQFWGDGLAPGHREQFIGFAVGFSYLPPAVGKSAVDAVEHFLVNAVAHGGFLQPGAGGGVDIDAAAGVEDLADFRLNAGK